MDLSNAKYVIDTCSLTELRKTYPFKMFAPVWNKLKDLVNKGIIISTEEVFEELKMNDDDVFQWVKINSKMFIPLDEAIQLKAQEILTTHPNLIDIKNKKSSADPFVIALALLNNCTVVSEENPSGGPNKSKIPDVCKYNKVDCIKLLSLLEKENFSLESVTYPVNQG